MYKNLVQIQITKEAFQDLVGCKYILEIEKDRMFNLSNTIIEIANKYKYERTPEGLKKYFKGKIP